MDRFISSKKNSKELWLLQYTLPKMESRQRTSLVTEQTTAMKMKHSFGWCWRFFLLPPSFLVLSFWPLSELKNKRKSFFFMDITIIIISGDETRKCPYLAASKKNIKLVFSSACVPLGSLSLLVIPTIHRITAHTHGITLLTYCSHYTLLHYL